MSPLDLGYDDPPLLAVEGVAVRLDAGVRVVRPLRGASLDLRAGRTLALVGESGSGKSMLGLAIAGLLPEGAWVEGTIRFEGLDLFALDSAAREGLRGRGVAFVPQAAGLSLNPCMRAAAQVEEVFRTTRRLGARAARDEAARLLDRLGLDRAAGRLYPHQLSGGMRQRLLVAIGLACRPRLLIADEPTKGIDPRRVDDVVDLFAAVRADDPALAMIVITHDLRFARRVADRVAVLYAGRVLEEAPAEDFFAGPRHPYARGLLAAAPERGLTPIPGAPPGMDAAPAGCPFAPRCAMAAAECHAAPPPPARFGDTLVACGRHDHV